MDLGNSSPVSGGIVIYDVAGPNPLGNVVINSFTTLAIPAYYRAVEFTSKNLASFERSVTKDGVKVPHRITPVLTRRPNNYQSATMFWRTLFFHRAHYANSYAELERDSLYNVVALHNRLPEQVTPFRFLDEDTGAVSTWYHVGGRVPHIVPATDMIHLSGLSWDGPAGLNPVSLHYETFERARTIDKYITRFLVKGSVIRGSIEIPAGATPEQQETIVDGLKTKFRGPGAEEDIIVLSDGAKLNNNTLSNDKAQLIELASYSTKQIAQITGIPPAFLYDLSEGKYNEATEQAYQMVVRDHFRPLIAQDVDELTRKLLTDAEQDQGYAIHIDVGDLVKGDTETETAVVTQQANAGVITRNEARGMLGLPPTGNPEDDKLRTLGDTNPQPTAAASPAPEKPTTPPDNKPIKNSAATIGWETFAGLIRDAAERVGTKTAKAAEAARKKFTSDNDGWTRWGNVFAHQQASYAAEAIGPVLATIETVCEVKADAHAIGDRYAARLRHYFAAAEGEAASPDLAAIVGEAFRNMGENDESRDVQTAD